jgi:aryl-alcohol dehydrogenase-like predicted oxidoreductase
VRQRQLGTSGVSASVIGLGGVEFGPEGDDEPDVARVVNVIEVAAEHGINWLDTSENYYATRNEAVLGAALSKSKLDTMVATKVAPSALGSGGGSGFRPEQVHAACRSSLQRLGRDHIDMYFLHWPDDTGVPLDETWGAMTELADAGLVRAIGMSNYSVEDIERCHRSRPVDVVQDGLSLVDHLENRSLAGRCAELGIGVTIYEPLASGVLGGKPMEDVQAAWAAWSDMPFYQRLLVKGRAERSWAVVDALRPIGSRIGATVAQLAIAWVLHQTGVDCAIAGSASGRHMEENARAAELDFTAVLDEIEQVIPLGPSFTPTFWTEN